MANIKENKKGFKVIQVSRSELMDKLGLYGAMGVCDRCNGITSTGYYIAVLNQWFCPDCYQDGIMEPNVTRKILLLRMKILSFTRICLDYETRNIERSHKGTSLCKSVCSRPE